ncbi:MAG: toxin-activating lysine-acyltransferase [Pseudomonadota bacterium]
MFWSRKKRSYKETAQEAERHSEASIIASETGSGASAEPMREQSEAAIEQLADLHADVPSQAVPMKDGHSTGPQLSSIERSQTVQSPVPVTVRYGQLGEIVSLLLKSPTYQRAALQDLEWLVLPPLRLGQISIAKTLVAGTDAKVPIGTVIWARVSNSIDHRLATELDKPIRLSEADWNSGSILWIVATAGETRVVRALIERVIQTSGLGSSARVRTTTPDGAVKVLDYVPSSQV